MAEANKKLDELKEFIKSIKDRVDSMCKNTCEEYNLDFEKEFKIEEKNFQNQMTKNDDKVTDEKNSEESDDNTDSFKKFQIGHNESVIHGHTLYNRAKQIFETRNGINEDGSDYSFDDFVRESISMRESVVNESINYFGAKKIIAEADEFDRYIRDWNARGRNRDDLIISGRETPEELAWKRRMNRILGNGENSSMDRDSNGIVTQREMRRYADNNTDINGRIPNEVLLRKGAEEIKGGIANYLSTFMPTSWARGLVNAPGKAIRKTIDKAGNTKIGRTVSRAYNTLGGNKALALGTLGSLAFGPIGGVVGAGIGKLAQKAIDLGNS